MVNMIVVRYRLTLYSKVLLLLSGDYHPINLYLSADELKLDMVKIVKSKFSMSSLSYSEIGGIHIIKSKDDPIFETTVFWDDTCT